MVLKLTKEERKRILQGRKKQQRCNLLLSQAAREACMNKRKKMKKGATLGGADPSFNVF